MESPVSAERNGAGGVPPAELAELRRLLFGKEHEGLDELRARFGDRERFAEELAGLLPELLARREQPDARLGRALSPTFEMLLRESARRHPEVMRDAVFPILGPAIRKAVSAAIAGLAQSINRTLEETVSVRSMRWRFQAWRTGRSFSDIVLLHSLLYRVEQVFLVHRESGLLLAHVSAQDAPPTAPDLVSGMVTAIGDFARDSLGSGDGELSSFRVGDLTMLVEGGPHAVVCVAVRGVPPGDLQALLVETVEDVHRELASPLAAFDGDATAFRRAEPLLERCLRQQRRPTRRSPVGWVLMGSAAAALVVGAVWWWSQRSARDALWQSYLERVAQEPGLLVVDQQRDAGVYRLVGLADPLAADPAQLLADAGLDPARVSMRWEPYAAAAFLSARARRLLEVPDSVRLDVRGQTLVLTGHAAPQWVAEAERRAPLLGATDVDSSGLVSVDLDELRVYQKRANALVPAFGDGVTVLDYERLRPVADLLAAAERLARQAGGGLAVTVSGYGDTGDAEAVALVTARRRANFVRRTLEELVEWSATVFEAEARGDFGGAGSVRFELQWRAEAGR